ncbi:MAG: sensor histidine kinase [Thiobacillus sp.]
MKNVFVRSFAFPALVVAGVALLVLGLMLTSMGRNLSALAPLQSHLAAMQRVQTQSLALQTTLARALRDDSPLERAALASLRAEIDTLSRDGELLTPDARQRLREARDVLAAPDLPPREMLHAALTRMNQALAAESQAHDRLLRSVAARARLEFRLAAAILVLAVAGGAAGFWFLRRRILDPLRDLDGLMQRLAEHDFARVETRRADSLIAPLLTRYNDMVARLAALEAAQAARQASLEAEVRSASRELIAYNRSLAEADKLAAVGELAASVAHELRNPLAGVTLALANLRHDLPEDEGRQRLDAAIAELRRMSKLANALLDQARHAPEAASRVELAPLVRELLALARYQIAPEIALEQHIEPALVCSLPADRLRQALLNLVLNAAQVLPERGTIRVAAAREGDYLALAVEDDGPGFPDTLLQQGVSAFSTQRAGGTGLGLAAVRRFALDLGGALALENLSPHGARASLRLPCLPPPETP